MRGPLGGFGWGVKARLPPTEAPHEMIMPRKELRQVLEVPYEAGADHAEGMTFIGVGVDYRFGGDRRAR